MKSVIGLTGSLASGCTTVANRLAENGYSKISISNDILSVMAKNKEAPFSTRMEKQTFGNDVRKNLRDEFKNRLLKLTEQNGDKVVVECFRNPIEISLFRDHYRHYYLIALYAPVDERKSRYQGADFKECNERDEGEKDEYGQQVGKCVNQADIVLDNSSRWIKEGLAREFL